MACLIPRSVVNPRYKKIAPLNHYLLYGSRLDYKVPVDCGRCINCFRKYMGSWRFRLIHEFLSLTPEQRSRSYYVTLTIEPKFYTEKKPLLKLMVRRFLDRARKKYGHSIRHFLVTERGEDTNRYHFHGFFFDTNVISSDIWNLWHYGYVTVFNLGDINENIYRDIAYTTTYITKGRKGSLPMVLAPEDRPLVLVSPGLGANYAKTHKEFHHQNGILIPFAMEQNGTMRSLPRYLRQKVFDESALKELSTDFFKNYDDDVIPDGPYYIGNVRYDDYTVYKEACKPYVNLYNQIYGKQHSRTSCFSFCQGPEEGELEPRL